MLTTLIVASVIALVLGFAAFEMAIGPRSRFIGTVVMIGGVIGLGICGAASGINAYNHSQSSQSKQIG